MVTPRQEDYMSKYTPPTSFFQQNFDCDKPWIMRLPAGGSKWMRCYRRKCSSSSCREPWSNKEYQIICWEHYWRPFHLCLTLIPPATLPDDSKLDAVHTLLASMRQWLYRNEHEWFDGVLYPDRHDPQQLHWTGFARASEAANIHWHKMLADRRNNDGWIANAPAIKRWQGWLAYACGREHQEEMGSISVGKRRMILTIGKPYRFGKIMTWEMMQLAKGM